MFPNKKYNIIYADPPWSYKDKASSGKRGANFKYPTQDKEWIKNLPVSNISEDNSILFLWVTMPLLQDGLDVMNAWGFKYKTIGFTWVKKNKKKNSWFFGMGNWTRSNAELCLIGIKGKIKRIDAGISSIVDSPIQYHSKKPDEVREKIVKLMGDIPRIELFARDKYIGWDCWGNEVDNGAN